MKILLVEDDAEIVKHVTHALSATGHDFESVMDGVAGFTRAASGDHAAHILDRMLPGMDGLEIVIRLRREGREAPVLMLANVENALGGLAHLEAQEAALQTQVAKTEKCRARQNANTPRVIPTS